MGVLAEATRWVDISNVLYLSIYHGVNDWKSSCDSILFPVWISIYIPKGSCLSHYSFLAFLENPINIQSFVYFVTTY